MGKITVLEETTKTPITLMGTRAGVCWGSDTNDNDKNFKRGLDCLNSGHGRVMEYVNVELVIDGYSARVIREWYTHLGGSPTRLQASTRYINYDNFDYVIPKSVAYNPDACKEYNRMMNATMESLKKLELFGIPREDISMGLPLGMMTKIVDKRNLRNLMDMSHQRRCARAYWEYRDMFTDICNALSEFSEEWKYVVNHYFVPKCEATGFCEEKNGCGYKQRRN